MQPEEEKTQEAHDQQCPVSEGLCSAGKIRIVSCVKGKKWEGEE